ncbi:VOC family protein [Pseudooceanicola spongiae]|jgi:2,3-dihydroxybiphenyl 1,2-dioxygenase|uniref:Biphenyl 2,3-dioxygenase n=1 Tax=Pseudooceanicola spongiae TaxID=2613965 RepID=A0A7L9WML1_9RHOB|nr:VOC family protein [Pseudooceanicola spongiae]QOL80967.1 biphenyl 2,3-dioxygenase [Pseudooceanicola spongiae]
MALKSLGYIGIRSSRTEEWGGFATQLLGMQQVDRGAGSAAFRMDDRKQRLMVTDVGSEGLDFMGWEVDSPAELDRLATRLENAGVAVRLESAALADQRLVGSLISFSDPDGNHIEVFCAPHIATDPFVPARPISGFKTGTLGMGHAVLHVTDAQALLPFYRDLLGFSVTDYGMQPYQLYFFHLNGRHHSFAMVGSGRKGLHHFMVELQSLDDVGQGYDLAQADGNVAYTLGRHSNDHMMSFYATSPSGFFVEYGWGARVIDPDTWQPHETTDGPSYWGHDRLYLPEGDPARDSLREMRMDAARRGRRAGDPVPDCAWLDSVVRRE